MKSIAKGLLFLFLSLFLLYGIGTSITVPLESVATSDKYKSLIGKSYSLNQNFVIVGIASDLNSRELSYYTIYPSSSVGFTGPEVVYRGKLLNNSKFKITNVLKSKWPLVAPRTQYVATFPKSTFNCNNKEIRIKEYWFNNKYFKKNK